MPGSESPKRANVDAEALVLPAARLLRASAIARLLRAPAIARLLRTSPIVLSLALTACGAGAAKELAVVRAELDQVHKEHAALSKRVGELESRATLGEEVRVDAKAGPAATPDPESAPATGPTTTIVAGPVGGAEPKPLKVVKLEPAPVAAAPEATPDDDEPRPFLKIGPSGSIEQSLPDEPAGKPGKKSLASKTPAFEPTAAKDYDAAYALVKAKKPKQALEAFGAFIVRYPDHPYAANALYWRGECYYQLGDYTGAAAQFDALTIRFPGSNKLAEALLKLGLSHRKLGSTAKARVAFERLKKDFPTSEAAKKIPPEDAS
jgi:tol-pal system protein YbgF